MLRGGAAGARVGRAHRRLLAPGDAVPDHHAGRRARDRRDAILLLIGTWNEFLFAVILGDRNAVTVTRRISQIQVIGTGGGIPPFTLAAAAGLLVALPCLLLVVLFHRRVIAGLTEGFVKG